MTSEYLRVLERPHSMQLLEEMFWNGPNAIMHIVDYAGNNHTKFKRIHELEKIGLVTLIPLNANHTRVSLTDDGMKIAALIVQVNNVLMELGAKNEKVL